MLVSSVDNSYDTLCEIDGPDGSEARVYYCSLLRYGKQQGKVIVSYLSHGT
jgi:hypothetical protein